MNMLDADAAPGATTDVQQDTQSTEAKLGAQSAEPPTETNPILDDSAAPQTPSFTVEQFLTKFTDEQKDKATTYLNKYADKEGRMRVDELAKAGFHAQSRLGGFTGAPDHYDIKTPEYMEGDVDNADPYIQEFMDAAKAVNMNQDTFSKLMDIHLRASIAPPVDVKNIEKDIGPDFNSMRANMAGFYKQKLSEDEFNTLNNMITSPEAFKTLYSVFQASRPTKIDDTIRENFNHSELKDQMEAEYLATDDHGNPRMRDEMYAKSWRERWEPFIAGSQ
jgi:hypothetical protein